jgi:hypothetical protein
MMRARVAARVGAEMPYGHPAARRGEFERRPRDETALEEARAQSRRIRVAHQVEQRQEAVARRSALEFMTGARPSKPIGKSWSWHSWVTPVHQPKD